jgi:DNA-binding transcriptional LysR family regulator
MLKLQQVRQFVIAAESGSFRVAADSTFRSPAAVSIAMRELEAEIGGRLLERGGQGKFTPLASSLLPMLKELLTVHDLVLSQSRQLAGGQHGSLSVAVAPFLAEEWLPDVLTHFAELYPGVRLQTLEERSSLICALVAAGTINIGVGGLLSGDPKLSITPVANDTYGVLCSTAHPLAARTSTTWRSLAREKVIGSDALLALIAAGQAPPLAAPHLVITSRAPLLACVRKNLGVTILPMLTRPSASDGLAFVPLVRPTLSRTVSIVARSSESLLPAGRRLVDLLARSLRDFAVSRGAIPDIRPATS